MEAMELYNLLGRKPFQPMHVVLKNGRTHVIPIRELAVVAETFVDIGFQMPGQPAGIWGGLVTVPLEDILRVEPLPLTTAERPS